MKHFYLTIKGLVLLLFAMANPASAQVINNDNEDDVIKINANMARNEYVPGQVLIKFKDTKRMKVRKVGARYMVEGASLMNQIMEKYEVDEMEQLLPNAKAERIPRRAKAYNGTTIIERDLTQLYKLSMPVEKAHQTLELVRELKSLDEVEFAEPNYKLFLLDEGIAENYSDNPFVNQQWYLDAYGVKELWNKPIVNSKRPIIAIIDTGVDLTHPDLIDNLWTNTAEEEGEDGYDNDGNGFKNDVHGWDFINNTPNIRDNNMHGTHVAGIAAAANNGIGIIGANPQALIMPVSVMQSDGTGDVATIIKGVDYAVANGATVLNLSLGTYANSRALRQSLERAYQKAVIVAAAGNDGICVNSDHHPQPCYGAAPMFPAAYSFVLGVQATQQNGSLASFSNYDDNGNTFSSVTTLQDPEGFNYELSAPGTSILSTIPGGKYKVLQGTSMASPLVAGAISALKMVKEYDTQEIFWGDLLHTNNIAEAYAVKARPAELDLMKIMYRERKELGEETEEDYSNDGEIDAGEMVSLYPVIRTTFGAASNIKMHLEMGDEFEDASVVEIITDKNHKVDFGLHLDAYGKGVSLNPLKVKIAENVADNRHIKLKFIATCDESNVTYEGHFTLVVNNMVKISGLISKDRTLTADHVYYVNDNLGIMEGATLTIEPGTRLEFAEGIGLSSFGKLIANGTPEQPIVFTSHTEEGPWAGVKSHVSSYDNPIDTISYCILSGYYHREYAYHPYMKDCILCPVGFGYNILELYGIRCNLCDINNTNTMPTFSQDINLSYSNIVNNYWGGLEVQPSILNYNKLHSCNYINSMGVWKGGGKYNEKQYALGIYSNTPIIDKSLAPSYLGTSIMEIIRPYIFEIGNAPGTYGTVDLSNMPTRPYAEAHGIVWKVVVNGKDAQDEYEDLAPLGVGKHKFEVYFNRPMNKNVAPQISFGLRDPYTQQVVAEDGNWNEEGTIYTAYKTIDGKTKSDGINRIYVYGAEDNEFFEIPYEKTRFNIQINAAGSMATGFSANAGMGRVNLTWDNTHNDFEDAMGFNIYRYTLDSEGNEKNNTRLNTQIVDIETTEYTDYDVIPGETYYYMYKVLSTDLQEYDVSNVVAATPLTSTIGDANGSGEVDVADVITTVNYAAGMEPKPFIFEAADMNSDQNIDILDVVGIIQKILNPNADVKARTEAVATYTVEDGIVYVETPVAIAGLQVQLNIQGHVKPTTLDALKGFEHASAWLTDEDFLFLAYNMSGKTIPTGKHPILNIGNGQLRSIRLSDAYGSNVKVEAGNATAIAMQTTTLNNANHGIYNLSGQKISGKASDLEKLAKGVYIVDGQKVLK